MAMKKIPTKDQCLLNASFHLSSFRKVIEELVYNSLDANSSSIAIRVCINKKKIQVLDNGTGIHKNDFRLLGLKYVTSKFPKSKSLKSKSGKYGYKGMSLACIIKISKNVIITSKCDVSQDTWLKTFCNSNTDKFCLTTSRPSKGTTIVISGFLYNLNIQQKSIDSKNELNNIKLFLEQLSLVHCNVSLSLRDDSSDEIIFKIHKNRDIYQTLLSLFEISRDDIQDLQVEKNNYKVKAYIAKNITISKKYHWIYLNNRIIFKTMLHKKINDLLCKKFMNQNTKKKITEKIFIIDERYLYNDKTPFYFIFVSCPNIDYDICYNNKQTYVEFKNWDDINKLFEKIINFYFGNMPKHVKDVKYTEAINKETFDTRKKVKDIMEKILDNKNKKNKISQLQNGVKGKQIKRIIKKKKNNTLQKLLYENSKENFYASSNSIDFTKSKELGNDTKKVAKINKVQYKNIIDKKPKTKFFIHADKNKKVSESIKNKRQKQIFSQTLTEKFEKPTDFIKRRCEKLSNEVTSLLDIEYSRDYEIYEKEVIQNITLSKGLLTAVHLESDKVTSRHSKQLLANIISQKQTKLFYYDLNIKNIKKSYDLVKTKDHADFFQVFSENIVSRQCTREHHFSYKSFYPYSTFNSHIKNKENCSKSDRNLLHRKSRNNFSPVMCDIINKEHIEKDNIHSKLNLIKTALSNRYNKKYYNKPNVYSNFNIDYEAIEREKYENIKPISNLNKNLDTICNKYCNYKNTCKIGILNSSDNTQHEVNKTYSVHMTAKFTYSNESKRASPYVFEKYFNETNESNVCLNSKVSSNINFEKNIPNKLDSISESRNSDKIIEPLQYCEAILQGHGLRDLEKEINKNCFNNVNNDVNKKSNDNLRQDKGMKTIVKNKNTVMYFCNNEDIYNYKNTEQEYLNINDTETTNNNQLEFIGNIGQPPHKLLEANNSTNNFKINSRHSFVPKGMSQFFKIKCNKNIAYNNTDEDYYEDAVYKEFAENIVNKFNIFGPSVNNLNSKITHDFTKLDHKIIKDSTELLFNSESLKFAKILGQVDRKFIAAQIKGRFANTGNLVENLVLFDQHAVDERVSLERNLSDYFDGMKWKSAPLEIVTLNVNEENYFYLHNYKDKFSQFGFEWTLSNNELLIHAIPKAVLGKNLRKAEVIIEAIKRIISEQICVIKLQRGNLSLYPKSIMELVFSESCRHAIKFGDYLSNNDCVNIIRALADCKTPFQCAHGRPVMAVVMELHNNFQHYTVNLDSIKKLKNICTLTK